MKKFKENSTIAAISTPPGTGGIGIIRISGEESFRIGMDLFRERKRDSFINLDKDKLRNRYLYYGYILDPEDESVVDEVLVVFMKGPGSYTSEDVVEIQAHSGRYVLKKILSLVINSGASAASPGEFTKRAFLNGRISLTQAESVMDIISSDSSASHKMAVSMAGGELGNAILDIQKTLVKIEAEITACVDFPDDVEDVLDLKVFTDKIIDIISRLNELKDNHDSGHQLREGLRISIVGPPNAGKSSLLNRMISRERSIVTSVPGTTRDVIEEAVSLNGFPLVISDTAGIRDTDDEVEKIGVRKSREVLGASDLVIFMVDGGKEMDKDSMNLFNEIKRFPFIFVVNKKDLLGEGGYQIDSDMDIEPVYISALKNSGIDDLKNEIFDFFENRFKGISSSIIPNQRQYEIILKILTTMEMIHDQVKISPEFELISYDINDAISLCSEILGENITPDILDTVFSDFCIGK